MPGCGKSTVGVVLAKSLGYNFIDTDLLIAEKAQMPLQQIIDSKGIDSFFEIEQKVGFNLNCNKCVIATGGSMVLSQKAMENLKQIATVVYIEVETEELRKRLTNFKTRGIVKKKGETVEDIFNKREGLYEKYKDVKIPFLPENHLEEIVHKIIIATK